MGDDAYTVLEKSTGNATDRTVFFMMQATDQAGTTYDDPDAEWEIVGYKATLSATGTFKITAVDYLGASTDLTDPDYLSANSGAVVDGISIRAGAKMDVAFTTTGGGNATVWIRCRPIHHSNSRLGMAEVP